MSVSSTANINQNFSQDSEATMNEPKENRFSKRSHTSSAESLEDQLLRDSEAGAGAKTNKQELSNLPQEPPLLSEKDSQVVQSIYEDVIAVASRNRNTSSHKFSHRHNAASYRYELKKFGIWFEIELP